ncbi:uncharacterized protein K02A2.6-like [Lytechinus pictus]|uniref:uncharacterized protein K02A2.6-like n=1 Tax=Lytechinus pictus TaxID=7653 RepID=UPI0030B9D222
MANLQPPPYFLPTPGTPAMPWKQWKGLFDVYLVASAANKFNEDRRRALLLHCLGAEGQRVFHTLPSTSSGTSSAIAGSSTETGAGESCSYAEAIDRLDNHFLPTVNVVAERYRFRQRGQMPDEPVETYVCALRSLSLTCAFGDLRDEFIRDQLVEKTNSERIRERLLIEPSLTLQSAMTIARQMESASRETRALNTPADSVNAVKFKPKRRQKQSGAWKQSTASQPEQKTVTCYRCGDKRHKANDVSCKAREATCNSCGKKGHFAKVCRSRQQAVHQISSEQSQLHNVEVLTIHPSKDAILFPVTVNGSVKLDLLFDTGSRVSIIPLDIFDKHFTRKALLPPRANCILTTYLTDEQIPVVGMFKANISHGDLTVMCEFFVATKGSCLMGRDLMKLLHVLPQLPDEVNAVNSEICGEFNELFSDHVGLAKGYVHRVKTKQDVPPVQHKLRRLPFAVRDKVSTELQRLVKADIIEPVESSEWISSLVVVNKKNGDIRLCVDLRDVNRAIVEDKYPLPHIEELLSEMRGATVFSTLDLKSAYHQLLLHEDSRHLTTFITHEGLFQFKRVCFGLSSAPSAFQKLMSSILAGLSGVQCYLDDIIIYGDTLSTHDTNLRAVLQRLQSVGLTLNLQKCQFNLKEISYLGHVISAKGVQPNEDNVAAIRDAPVPEDAATLRSFLGLASYYAKFIPNFSSVTAPLRELTKKDVSFVWSTAAAESFATVKDQILHCSTLHLFDPDLPVVISTDASEYGLGAVLMQMKDGKEVPISYASRTLTKAEKNYSVGEKEALACVWACEKWFQYVWGRHFVLRTDHQSLTTLLSTKGTGRQSMRIARWATRLLRFNYTVEYIPGLQNHAADALSRLPQPTPSVFEDDDHEVVIQSIFAEVTISKAELQQATASDSILQRVIEKILHGWSKESSKDSSLKAYYMIRDELTIIDDCVFRGNRVVIPKSLQAILITNAHSAHQGIVRTKQRLRDIYWWSCMDRMVEDAIHNCSLCQSSDKVSNTRNTPLQSVPLPDGPWKKIGIDITGPFNTTQPSYKYAIVAIDYYSKWPEVAFVSEVTTHSVITFLTQVFAREGIPSEVVTDNGVQFVSSEFEDFLKKLGISHSKASLYYPRSNGEVERWNRVLKQTLQIATMQGKPWKEAVLELLMAYRATPHQTTGTTPAELLHGRPMVTPLHIHDANDGNRRAGEDTEMRRRVGAKQKKAREYADKTRGASIPKFSIGDKVRVKRVKKKNNSWFEAPQKIVAKKGLYTFVLEDGRIWNASKLTLFRDSGHVDQRKSNTASEQTGSHNERPKRDKKVPVWTYDYVSH